MHVIRVWCACHKGMCLNTSPILHAWSHPQLTIHGIDASGKGCQRLMLKYAGDGEYQMMKGLVEAGTPGPPGMYGVHVIRVWCACHKGMVMVGII